MSIEPPDAPSLPREIGEATTRAALSAVPMVGGAAVEVFTFVTQRGYEKRVRAWMADVSDAINRLVLEPHGLDWEALEDNEGFLDAIAHAARSAAQTSSEAKRTALRAAVVNAALGMNVDADRMAILLDLLDTLTASHLRLLALFGDPRQWLADHGIPEPNFMAAGRARIVELAFPDIAADRAFMDKLATDLDTHGLAALSLHALMSGEGLLQPAIQPLGAELLAFVTEPVVTSDDDGRA